MCYCLPHLFTLMMADAQCKLQCFSFLLFCWRVLKEILQKHHFLIKYKSVATIGWGSKGNSEWHSMKKRWWVLLPSEEEGNTERHSLGTVGLRNGGLLGKREDKGLGRTAETNQVLLMLSFGYPNILLWSYWSKQESCSIYSEHQYTHHLDSTNNIQLIMSHSIHLIFL